MMFNHFKVYISDIFIICTEFCNQEHRIYFGNIFMFERKPLLIKTYSLLCVPQSLRSTHLYLFPLNLLMLTFYIENHKKYGQSFIFIILGDIVLFYFFGSAVLWAYSWICAQWPISVGRLLGLYGVLRIKSRYARQIIMGCTMFWIFVVNYFYMVYFAF